MRSDSGNRGFSAVFFHPLSVDGGTLAVALSLLEAGEIAHHDEAFVVDLEGLKKGRFGIR